MTTWNEREIRAALRDALETNHARRPPDMQREPHAYRHYTTHDPYALGAMAAPILEDWDAAHFETPTRAPTMAGDVAVPLAQAGICGVLGAILTGAAILATDAAVSGWAALAAGALVTAGAWSWLLRDHRRLLRTVEDYSRRDAPQLTPEPPTETLRLEVQQDKGDGRAHWLMEDLPIDADRLRTWARGVLGGRSLAQAGWTGRGGPFSRSEYDALLAAMLRAGVVRWINEDAHAQGSELTPMGRATLRRLTE